MKINNRRIPNINYFIKLICYSEKNFTWDCKFSLVWNICKKLWIIYKEVSPYAASQLLLKWLSFYFNKLYPDGGWHITITIYILSRYKLSLVITHLSQCIDCIEYIPLTSGMWCESGEDPQSVFFNGGAENSRKCCSQLFVALSHFLCCVLYTLFVSRSLQSLNLPFLSNWLTFKPNFVLFFYPDAFFPLRSSSDYIID